MRKFNKYIKADSLYHNPYYGKEWGQSNHKIYIDGEYQTFSQYFRNEGNYRVDIIPKYIEKSDMLVWEVSVYPLTGDLIFPKKVESFETFYDAMDFVDSGELTYRLGITASRKFTKYSSNYVVASSNLASLRARAKYNFSWLEDVYLGGYMIAVYGQLTNGNYFYTNDSIDGVWFLNSNPEEMLNYWEDDYWYDWLDDHEVGAADGREYYRFWIDMFWYCKKNSIKLDTYNDLDYAIAEFKQFL